MSDTRWDRLRDPVRACEKRRRCHRKCTTQSDNTRTHTRKCTRMEELRGCANAISRHHAISTGCLRVFQWLVVNDLSPNDATVFAVTAARTGQLRISKWLYTRGADMGGTVADTAAGYGHVNILNWAGCKRRCITLSERLYVAAARGNQLGVMRWLLRKKVRCVGADFSGATPDALRWIERHAYELATIVRPLSKRCVVV